MANVKTGASDSPLTRGNQKPGKGNFRDLKSLQIPRGACPQALLEACSTVPRLGNRSVFILDPRLKILSNAGYWVLSENRKN